MRVLASAIAAVLLGFGGAAAAQTVYKYTDANGRTAYTNDARLAASKRAQRVDPVISEVGALPAPAKLSELDRRFLDDALRRAAGLDRAASDIVSASRALDDAEERRALGLEPQEGERIGRRFRDEYWQRQAMLELELQGARARLDDAFARRNALR